MKQTALPEWDLTDLYASFDAAELAEDKERLAKEISDFAAKYRGIITTLHAEDFGISLQRYEAIENTLGKISAYADLMFAIHASDDRIAAATQDLQEYITDIASLLIFYELEINQLDEAVLEAWQHHSAVVRHYAPWLRDVRAFKQYQLDEQLEQLLLDKSIAANASWIRLYDDMSTRMRVHLDGNPLCLTEALELLSDPQEETRKKAAFALSEVFSEHAPHFALIFNTLIKDKAINDKWRGFARPVSSRNLANLVEDAIVDTLASTVQAHYNQLSERYYRLKAKWLGKERLDYWDRNAPLPEADETPIAWDSARQMVLEAYMRFSPEMAKLADNFFTHHWIDAAVKEGKTSGAFSHPTSPSVHPYIMLNYQGKLNDVMTLAHELGHGVHQLLAAEQGALMADTPLTLAETASVFGEQLTFRYILEHETNAAVKKHLIAGKVEDMLNTVVRQIAFYQFETRLHEARRNGELSADTISQHWMDTQSESFGDAIHLDSSYRPYWTYISHFFHSPFYVYAYAFGDCLVNSLYALYEEAVAKGEGRVFEQTYLEMLRAGGSKRHKELLAPFGIDIAEADFWAKGLSHISRLIDMLETM